MDQSLTRNKRVSELSFFPVLFTGLVTGIINALIMKQQDQVGSTYVHPYFQTCQVFFANCLLLLVYYVLNRYNPNFRSEAETKVEDSKSKLNIFVPILPAFIDFVGLNLTFTAIYAVLPSILVMMKGTMPVINSMFSVIFLQGKLQPHQKIGAVIVFIGAVLACVEQVALTHIESTSHAVLGLIFMVLCLLVSGVQHVVEQKISKKYSYHPFELTGYEGIWGLIFGLIALIVTNFISCDVTSPFCSGGHLENLDNIGQYMNQNGLLVFLVVLALLNPVLLNLNGAPMKQFIPSAVGTGLDVFIVFFAWFYTLFYLQELFIVTHLIGFLLFGVGTLIFQKVIVIPGFGEKTGKLLDSSTLNENESGLLLNTSNR